ncbi:hypothetical protein Tco_1135504 [Tanacetum coccineum]
MEESDSEDSEDLNKETKGENNEDEIRVAIERKRTRKIKEKDMKSNEKDEGSNSENEVLSVAKGKKRETMKKKTKDSNPKEKKLRNSASEDKDDTESESEDELKKLRKGSIKATRQKVYDILGIPMGNTKLQDLEQRDVNDPFIDEWEEKYSHLQKPTPPAIALQILGTHKADFMFKMNFITLFGSTMGTLENGGRVPTKLLKCIKEEDDLADIDWCDYILDCLRTSKFNWKDVKTKKNFYYGPLTFLCLLYLDSTFFPDLNNIRHRPTIRSWNTMMMRKKIKMETSQRCLGSLEHHGEFDPEEEQNGIDLYKRLDVYIEPLSDRIPVTKEFEDDQMMFDFCKQYKEMFNDVEFNLYESSKDEDSDNDSDPDNDNNKDDEEEPMTDGKNQNENERQSGIQKEKENIEDMGKGTKEGGSEANDNGKKDEYDVNIENEFEKVNEKDDEEAFLMDVDDPNEKMKEKEADKEKVSDSIEKEQQVESEKEKQYEADKVEKV